MRPTDFAAKMVGRAWPSPAPVPIQVLTYIGCMAFACAVIGASGWRLATVVAHHYAPAAATAPGEIVPPRRIAFQPPPVIVASIEQRQAVMRQSSDEDWSAKLSNPAYWNKLKADRGKPSQSFSSSSPANKLGATPARLADPDRSGDDRPVRSKAQHRTMCVRLCDGFFWPISFTTTEANFERDQKTCEASCSGGARLFTYKNPGEEFGDMQDLQGRPYKKLATAFLFRASYDESCKCRSHPWEEASLDRHRLYAMEAAQRKSKTQLSAEWSDLKAKVAKAQASLAKPTPEPVVATAKVKSKRAAVRPAKPERAEARSIVAEARPTRKPLSTDGVVILRLGAKPPVAVKVSTDGSRRTSEDWRRRVFQTN